MAPRRTKSQLDERPQAKRKQKPLDCTVSNTLLGRMPIDVTETEFKREVLEKSREAPVLVDFWAEWCAPCRMLAPILEKLEAEYAGRFVLVKANTDASPGLARDYQVSGIPAVKLFVEGSVQDEFTGALPEAHVRQFLERNLPDPAMEKIKELARTEPAQAARAIVREKRTGPRAEQILWRGIQRCIVRGETGAELDELLGHVPEVGSPYSDARNALAAYLAKGANEEAVRQLGRIFQEDDARPALDYFLKQVEDAPRDEMSAKKEGLLTAFHLLGNKGELVNEYRRQLSRLLF